MQLLITDLNQIKHIAEAKRPENDVFRAFVKNNDPEFIDAMVHELNDNITPQIDCTQCGNCCKSLMINVSKAEAEKLAQHINMDLPAMKQQFLEESEQGQLIMNTIPCYFLSGTKCSIYENRFSGCREFPYLDQDNFSSRLFALLIHYEKCPIIFNVIEALKLKLQFFNPVSGTDQTGTDTTS